MFREGGGLPRAAVGERHQEAGAGRRGRHVVGRHQVDRAEPDRRHLPDVVGDVLHRDRVVVLQDHRLPCAREADVEALLPVRQLVPGRRRRDSRRGHVLDAQTEALALAHDLRGQQDQQLHHQRTPDRLVDEDEVEPLVRRTADVDPARQRGVVGPLELLQGRTGDEAAAHERVVVGDENAAVVVPRVVPRPEGLVPAAVDQELDPAVLLVGEDRQLEADVEQPLNAGEGVGAPVALAVVGPGGGRLVRGHRQEAAPVARAAREEEVLHRELLPVEVLGRDHRAVGVGLRPGALRRRRLLHGQGDVGADGGRREQEQGDEQGARPPHRLPPCAGPSRARRGPGRASAPAPRAPRAPRPRARARRRRRAPCSS